MIVRIDSTYFEKKESPNNESVSKETKDDANLIALRKLLFYEYVYKDTEMDKEVSYYFERIKRELW